jgi:oligoribonuclease
VNKFFFIDLETTGLDERQNCILEVAAIITDNKLNILEEFTAPIKAAPIDLALMDTWCSTTHTQSRLLQDIEEKGIALADAEKELQKLKRKHFPVNKPPISGSSVHFDKRFIDAHMKSFSKELSHRIIDVSSFMGALDNYYGFKLPSRPEASHRALADIKDSISYLKAYLEEFGHR